MTHTISSILRLAAKHTSSIEPEMLLAHLLEVSRAYLHTWPEKIIDPIQQQTFFALLEKHLHGEPIAYLTGHREFWSLDFIVTRDVLIPRQETELLVELTLNTISKNPACIADLGTGSGCIALAIAHEKPHWMVHATDLGSSALHVAKQNAKRLSLSHVTFHQGNWCRALPSLSFDAIISNPPYIAQHDPHLASRSLSFEPQHALISDNNGLQDLSHIILEARNYLNPGGILLLEHGYQQASTVTLFLTKAGYTDVRTHQDLNSRDRVTIASWMGF